MLRPVDDPDAVARLARELNHLPEALARALVVRGITTFEAARRFFRPSREDLHDPFLMQDMEAAAHRVVAALERGERILVYGDYDVDGTTATTLLTHFLRSRGADVHYFVPHRFRDGYGLGPAGIEAAAAFGAALIVALDCGITAVEEAAAIRARGMDLVICDHHTAHETLPDAVAVLDPKRPDCSYPFKELCGCGVTFKLVQAVLTRLGEPAEAAFDYLDLVAVATASDIVPMTGENRILMREGLERLRQARPGLRALAEAAGIDLQAATTSNLVFGIGPRINAAGRLDEARLAVDLLLTEDPGEARTLARRLEALNDRRREIDEATLEQAIRQAEQQLNARDRRALVLHHPEWHLGVIGIVASRIVERFYRPTILLTSLDDQVKGSARSIRGVNIFDALATCSDLLVAFGGHDYAAGLTLDEADLPLFRERFEEAIRAAASDDLFLPALEVDALLDLNDIDNRFWAVLRQFAPCGPGNPTPVFQARDLAVVGTPRTVGRDGKHLKFAVRQRQGGATLPVIGFGLHRRLPAVEQSAREGRPLELVFSVDENTWNGQTTLQLRARDVRLADR